MAAEPLHELGTQIKMSTSRITAMTDLTNELTVRFARQKAALLWLLGGLGNTIYAVIQILTLVNHQMGGAGAESTAFDAIALWYFGVACSLWIVPALLPLVTSRRPAGWGSLLLGGLLVLATVAGSVADGMRDGFHITATALLAVALPVIFAVRASWRLLRVADSSAGQSSAAPA